MSFDGLRKADIAAADLPPKPFPEGPREARDRLMLPQSFDELSLFALLLWKFKKPNGPITFLGRPGGDPDGPFKWDFLFRLEGVCIQVIRTVNGIEVWWWGRQTSSEAVLEFLSFNLGVHAQDIQNSIGSLEKYTLILNPYFRHRRMAETARKELLAVSPVPPPEISVVGPSREHYEEQGRGFRNYLTLVDRQAMNAMLLVSESAFVVEAYLNLMYAILLRDEIRRSPALTREALFRKWRNKIEHLPADCRFIASPPDLGDTRVRDAGTLFDIRNQIAHSFPDTTEMKIGEMWFFQNFPVLPSAVPAHHFALTLNNQLPSREQALFSFDAGTAMVAFLRGLLDSSIVDSFDAVANANPLGFNETKGIYGIPFGEFVILGMGGF
jgi:hypothetical protein